MNRRRFTLGLLAAPAFARRARAATTRIRLGKQYGLPFLPQMVMEAHRLIEQHAAKRGVPSLAVGWETLSGPGALNDALLSGTIEFVNVAPPSLATLWEKTASTRPVRALCTVQSMPYVLVTRNAAVASTADFTDADRIAVPTVKISGQALALQMATAKLWGFDQYARLDPLTVSMAHPDAVAALLSGRSPVNSHFATAPFQYYELATPGIHQVLNSYATVGGRHTNGVQVTTMAFHRDNPAICAAVFAAHEEANAFIKRHPRDAAEIYLSLSHDRRSSADEIVKMITDPDIDYTTTPANLMQLVEFMHKVGRLARMPDSWKDMFLPEAHGLAGS